MHRVLVYYNVTFLKLNAFTNQTLYLILILEGTARCLLRSEIVRFCIGRQRDKFRIQTIVSIIVLNIMITVTENKVRTAGDKGKNGFRFGLT